MQIDWNDERCIVCLRTPSDADPTTVHTDAHVIPQSIGGELSATSLCKRCNSEMGRMEALLARDISVRRRSSTSCKTGCRRSSSRRS